MSVTASILYLDSWDSEYFGIKLNNVVYTESQISNTNVGGSFMCGRLFFRDSVKTYTKMISFDSFLETKFEIFSTLD